MDIKLWVDDIRNAPDDSWVVTRNITSSIRALKRFNVTQISLDHDISHQVGMEDLSRPFPCGECFCAVAYFLGELCWGREEHEMPKVTIHTSNPAGAEEMKAILESAKIYPTVKMMGSANRLEMEI